MKTDEREVRQLLFLADLYLNRAKDCANEVRTKQPALANSTNKDAADWWNKPMVSDGERLVSECGGHVASASMRLCTIDRLLNHGTAFTVYEDCTGYFNRRGGKPGAIHSRLKDWLHILLRDNIGHGEQEDNSKRFEERLRELEPLKVLELIPPLEATRDRLFKEAKNLFPSLTV